MGLINSNQSWASYWRCTHFFNQISLIRYSFSPSSPTPHLNRNITLKTQALKALFDRRNLSDWPISPVRFLVLN